MDDTDQEIKLTLGTLIRFLTMFLMFTVVPVAFANRFLDGYSYFFIGICVATTVFIFVLIEHKAQKGSR